MQTACEYRSLGWSFLQASGLVGRQSKIGCNIRMKPYSDSNTSVRNVVRFITRRLVILFDVLITILLIVLLGDGEDDLRLHPAFVQAIQAWCR